jgi:hypothetical protein
MMGFGTQLVVEYHYTYDAILPTEFITMCLLYN